MTLAPVSSWPQGRTELLQSATSNARHFWALVSPGKVLAFPVCWCQHCTENGSGLLSNTHVVHVFLNMFFK